MITAGGYGSRLSPHCREVSAGTTAGSVLRTNLRLYEIGAGAISLFPVVINNGFYNSNVSGRRAPNLLPQACHPICHPDVAPSVVIPVVIPCVIIRRHNVLCI
jgi:hypothetical protein